MFEEQTPQLAELLTRNNGKTLDQAMFEVSMVALKLRFYAATVLTQYGRAMDVADKQFSYVLTQPIGVAGIVVPWN